MWSFYSIRDGLSAYESSIQGCIRTERVLLEGHSMTREEEAIIEKAYETDHEGVSADRDV
jgi:hypothetical protein